MSDRIPIERIPRTRTARLAASWKQADPARIAESLADAESRDPGGWFVVGAASDVPTGRSVVREIAGREVALWRDGTGGLHAGPGACPHLGAALDDCPVVGDSVRCRWHGLALGPKGRSDWRPWAAHDDGVLAWVHLPGHDRDERDEPVVTRRPPLDRSLTAVITATARCEPRDIVANRLDPWHGSWLHPYAFSHLTVDEDESSVDRLVVDVVFRLGPTYGVPVRAEFSCPDARTIVMHIVSGEGAGSVVETHATPLGTDRDGAARTLLTEATIAYSDRKGFRVATGVGALVRPMMRRSQRRLWVDDLAYAERTYRVRRGEVGGPARR